MDAARVSLLRWLRRQLREPSVIREHLEAAVENDDPAEARRQLAGLPFSDLSAATSRTRSPPGSAGKPKVPRAAEIDLSPAEWASLALLAEQPAHGFAVARELAPEGEVGRSGRARARSCTGRSSASAT